MGWRAKSWSISSKTLAFALRASFAAYAQSPQAATAVGLFAWKPRFKNTSNSIATVTVAGIPQLRAWRRFAQDDSVRTGMRLFDGWSQPRVRSVRLNALVNVGTESAGINRHIVGEEEALRKRRSDSIPASSLAL
jgi:hypothetical protein